MWWNSEQGDLRIQNNINGDFSLNPYGGNVGIGTTNPIEKLEVNGNIKVDGDIIIDGQYFKDLLEEFQMLMDITGIGTLTDIDGNIYRTVKIGEQIWMAENLKVTHLNNGTPIPYQPDNMSWCNTSSLAYCWYANNSGNYEDPYGAHYNWFAADNENICPSGWHVPTVDEFNILRDSYGGRETSGGKMKETGTRHWRSPNTGATNESGFTALPGGARSSFSEGMFMGIYNFCEIWTASQSSDSERVYAVYMNYYETYSAITSAFKNDGHNIRCMKD